MIILVHILLRQVELDNIALEGKHKSKRRKLQIKATDFKPLK